MLIFMKCHLGHRSMPRLRRRQSLMRRLIDARLAKSQYSQEVDELNLSVTRSPDKWRSRMKPSSQVNILYNVIHFPQQLNSCNFFSGHAGSWNHHVTTFEEDRKCWWWSSWGKYASRSNLNHFFLNRNQLPRQLNSCNFFQDMQEAEIIMSPLSKKIKNVDGDPVEVNMQAAVIWIAAINKECTQLSQ